MAGRERIQWIDSVKGVGIMLVVMGHVLGGLIDAALAKPLGFEPQAFVAIYSFHMPLFFMLSGLMVADRIDRNASGFAKSLLQGLVWPYFLWSILQYSAIYMAGSLVNRPVDNYWETILALPWRTVSQFWFLYALFLLHVLAWLALPRIGRRRFFVLCFVVFTLGQLLVFPGILRQTAHQILFYGLGVMLGPEGVSETAVGRPVWERWLYVLVAVAVIALGLGAKVDVGVPPADGPPKLHIGGGWKNVGEAIIGSFAAVALASLARGRLQAVLGYIGRRTMPIFLMHILAIAGSRIFFVKVLHVDQGAVMAPLLFALGLLAPLAAEFVLTRLRLSPILGFSR